MSFDRLARIYQALEMLVFGRALSRTRMQYLDEMKGRRQVLVLGDGDGRFISALARNEPDVQMVSVDSSPGMLRAARSRLAKSRWVYLICGDARQLPVGAAWIKSCDGIVSHFFLDCLQQSEVDELVSGLATSENGQRVWLISEFAIPERQPWRLLGAGLIAILYWGTGRITGLQTRRLPDYARSLRREGFELRLLTTRWKGLLRSEVWVLRQFS